MKRAAIIGGSVGGLLAGNMLLRKGWHVDIYERSRNGLESRGAGIAPQRTLLEALGVAGVEVQADIGVPISSRRAYDKDGTIVASSSYDQKTTSWGLIYQKLLQAFPPQHYHLGARQRSFVESRDGVTVTFEGGLRIDADLLVGADGMRSNVRKQLFPLIEPQYAGYVAWRGVLDERRVSGAFVEKYFGSFSFALLPGEQLIGYPVAGTDGSIAPGRRRFNVMWYRPVEAGADFDDLATGTDGIMYPGGIPPALIRPGIISAMKADAERLFPSDLAGAIIDMDDMFYQAIYDLSSDRMASERVALVGDAAFVARPHCGAGVSKAASDSVALMRALAENDSVASAMSQYSSRRTIAGKAAVLWASHLGSYLQVDGQGRRRADFDALHPPVSVQFVVENTGIDLADAFRANF